MFNDEEDKQSYNNDGDIGTGEAIDEDEVLPIQIKGIHNLEPFFLLVGDGERARGQEQMSQISAACVSPFIYLTKR